MQRSLTILGDLRPLGVGEAILAQTDPPLHSWGDGLARVGVEGRETAQPGGRQRSLSTGVGATPERTLSRPQVPDWGTGSQTPWQQYRPLVPQAHPRNATCPLAWGGL